jgi:Leucine-rich repeat (LRR) protein
MTFRTLAIQAAMVLGVMAAQADITVTFTDANLESAVRQALAKPTGVIYDTDMQGLVSLDACDRGIAGLAGLEYAINLTWLELCNNSIGDLAPLAGLASLEHLDLRDNAIGDITALSAIGALTSLKLSNNPLTSIAHEQHQRSITLGRPDQTHRPQFVEQQRK